MSTLPRNSEATQTHQMSQPPEAPQVSVQKPQNLTANFMHRLQKHKSVETKF